MAAIWPIPNHSVEHGIAPSFWTNLSHTYRHRCHKSNTQRYVWQPDQLFNSLDHVQDEIHSLIQQVMPQNILTSKNIFNMWSDSLQFAWLC